MANITQKLTKEKGALLFRIVVLIFFTMLMACSTPPQTPASEQTGETDRLRVGMRRGPDSLNPFLSTTQSGLIIASRLFPKLFYEEPQIIEGRPGLSPRLVETYSWDASQTTLTLVLKDDLRWSDGNKLTSADVAFSLSLRENVDVAWLFAGIKPAIIEWHTPSAKVITIRFERASPFNLMNLNESFILPAYHFGAVPENKWRETDWAEDLVTFGPYRIKLVDSDERLFLEGIAPDIPDLGIAFIRERETLYQLLVSEELDFAWGLPQERIADIRKHLNPVIYSNLNYSFVGWNLLDPSKVENPPETPAQLERLRQAAPHPIFGDANVRQAMTYGMNRAAYLNRFWDGMSQIPTSPWGAGLPYYQPAHTPRDFDPDQAATLLDAAGWRIENGVRRKNGRELRFTVISLAGSAMREQYLLAIQADLEQLGVAMEIELQEVSKYVDALQTRKFDAYFGVFHTGSNPDLSQLYHSEAALAGGYNYISWGAVDALLEDVRDVSDVSALSDGLLEMERIFYQQQPLTLLYKGLEIGASTKNGPKAKSNYLDPLFRVETWTR